MSEEEYEDWYITGPRRNEYGENYIELEGSTLTFSPGPWKNLLGRATEWRADLEDWQVQELAAIADEDGGSLKIDWGVFICPAYIDYYRRQLVVDTGGTW